MKFYISAKGIKRVIATSEKPTSTAAGGRRISAGVYLPAVVFVGILLPFLFLRIAFLVLESAALCSSLDCVRWRFLGESDTSLKLRDELTRVLQEANDSDISEEGAAESFNELVKQMRSFKRQDLKAFAFKIKATLSRMEHKVQSARHMESIYWNLASHGVPKSLNCLSLKLAEEYSINAMARSRLPPAEFVSRLVDPTFHHLVLLTDNVLAASVVVTSTVENSANPGKLVFHIVTDKKTYYPMHSWFAINSVKSAVLEVRGLHQYDWPEEVNAGIQEILETNQLMWMKYYKNIKEMNFINHSDQENRIMKVPKPSSLSLMNILRIYIPELFPDLKKVIFLDDDVVVQHDISSLWELELDGKVSGSVFKSSSGEETDFPGGKYINYLNFSHPLISSNFYRDQSIWLYGMNIFDLEAWRRSNITETYFQWLKLHLKNGFTLWKPGVLPPALIAFEGKVHPIDSSWLMTDLGYHYQSEVSPDILEDSAVLHFSGPAKPWLEIGFPKTRGLWNRYVNYSDKFIRRCGITH